MAKQLYVQFRGDLEPVPVTSVETDGEGNLIVVGAPTELAYRPVIRARSEQITCVEYR